MVVAEWSGSNGGYSLLPTGSSGGGASARWRNRRPLVKAVLGLCACGVLGFLASVLFTGVRPQVWGSASQNERPDAETHKWDSSLAIKGDPTMSFRENLREDTKYITSFVSAGWTNDVMTYMNLIYLAILTERVPILPTFIPSHIGREHPDIPVGEVFDLPRLRETLRMPVLEWQDVKNQTSEAWDEVGCWNTWIVSKPGENRARLSRSPELLKLDISYTAAPKWISLPSEPSLHLSFSALAALGFPGGPTGQALESPRSHVKLPPDDQLLCYDYLYYVSSQFPMEYDYDYSPAWRFVGQHLHWSAIIDELADQYVRRALGTTEGDKTPTWIAVHLRHGDFSRLCAAKNPPVPVEDCFAPLSAVARRVDEVKAELLQRKGIVVEHVIMTSDETSTEWWDGVRARGWVGIDHSVTVEKYGKWYPIFIDAAIQSGGMGFVGTHGSTMSVLARRRVVSWRDGAIRTVKWGRPGADDH